METPKRPAYESAAGGPAKVPRPDDGARPSTSAAAALLTAICTLCNAAFMTTTDLARHVTNLHGSFTCDICPKTFTLKNSLTRHRKTHDPKPTPTIECHDCRKTFTRKSDLNQHLKTHSPRNCEECGKVFQTKAALTAHRKTHVIIPLAAVGRPQPTSDPRDPTTATCPPKGCTSALNGAYERYSVDGTETDVDVPAFLRSLPHAQQIRNSLMRKKGVKFFISTNVKMVRPKNWITRGDPESFPYFTSRCVRVMDGSDIEELLEVAYAKIVEDVAKYLREGSGWVVHHVEFVDLVVSTYRPLRGSSYIRLPSKLSRTRSIINVQNEDAKCFLWAVLSALHPPSHNPQRLYHYRRHESSLKMGNLKFPMSTASIPKFEKLNALRINLFGFQDKEVFPIYISKSAGPSINLMLISEGTKQHYCWIKDFARLMNSNTKHGHKCFYCLYCLHRFSEQRLLDQHAESCRHHGPQKIRLPDEQSKYMNFKHISHSLPVPYVIYADFESTIVPLGQQAGSKTERTAEHRPASVCYIIVGPEGELLEPPFLYRGEDCVDVFLTQLQEKELVIQHLKSTYFGLHMTAEEEDQFKNATSCHICGRPLGDCTPHRDHDHMTGEFLGAAHPRCNLNYKQRAFTPVVLHNLRGYDAHLIMQQIGKHKDSKIDCLANNFEKYISFTFRTLRFIDSLQFMNESLEKLVSNLARSGPENFKLTVANFPTGKLPYVLAKGHFPYEYFDSLDRLEETELPPQSAFHSTLTNTNISDEDYAHANEVWNVFNMSTFGDYHDLYLKTDVLLLADVFQNFRKVCQSCYDLDPGHYYTSPGLAWDAALKKSNVTLELLTDPNMYLFVEEGTRGGISMISNRYAKANNHLLPDFDSAEPSSHIAYLDANNLYGWAMSQALPVGGFEWITNGAINLTNLQDDGEVGYILEVDLKYPEALHDSHSDYPLAPERMPISDDMLSPYSRDLLEKLGMKHMSKIEKLVPNLKDKSRYILHSRNLKFYMAHGMVLTKLHRALKFRQSPWLKSYINFNTIQRTLAKTEFEKNFFKLMNNAVFGKTMENLRKRRDVKLVHTQKRYEKLVAQPGFESSRRFCEDLVGVEMCKTSLFLNRPIYVGFAVLDISKILMYRFFYDVLKKKYGEKVKLLFTDTDSLLVQIFTEDLYADMKTFEDLLDTSDYPTDHPLHSTTNKKVIGKMKDEMNSVPIVSYVGLRAKMYSIKPLVGGDKKTAKGVSKSVVKNTFHHEDYERVLLGGDPVTADMGRIQSNNHHLYSLRIQKLGLSAADDKRFVLPNGCDTRAHGHYRNAIV